MWNELDLFCYTTSRIIYYGTNFLYFLFHQNYNPFLLKSRFALNYIAQDLKSSNFDENWILSFVLRTVILWNGEYFCENISFEVFLREGCIFRRSIYAPIYWKHASQLSHLLCLSFCLNTSKTYQLRSLAEHLTSFKSFVLTSIWIKTFQGMSALCDFRRFSHFFLLPPQQRYRVRSNC